MKKTGRKKLSEIDVLKLNACKKYWSHQHTLSNTFLKEQSEKEVQFSGSDMKVGRKPISIGERQKRAEADWDAAFKKLNEYEKEHDLKHLSIIEIAEYKKYDFVGRKKKDAAAHLAKYIRSQQRLVDDLVHADANEDNRVKSSKGGLLGRTPMSKEEKINYYKNKIAEAQKSLNLEIQYFNEIEKAYFELSQMRIKKRQLGLIVEDSPKAGKHYLAKADAREQLAEIIPKIELANKKYKALRKAEKDAEMRKARDIIEKDKAIQSENSELEKRADLLEKNIELKKRIAELEAQLSL